MPIELLIPGINNSVPLSINGRPTFILGRNGTGKSALVHYLRTQIHERCGANFVYLPGSRPSYFDSENLSMTHAGRKMLEANSLSWDRQPGARVRQEQGSSRNERAIFDLLSATNQYNADIVADVQRNGTSASAIAKAQSRTSPLDRVNNLLAQANLPIQIQMANGELHASRNSSFYSIANMSDGERIAFILISEVISAKPGAFFLIDEPELHLHRAIVVPLISALIAERPDCTMFISTHELELPNACPNSSVMLVRGCIWAGNEPKSWQIDLLPNPENIPEEVRTDVLGSRQKILFVEGKSSSLDQPLYALLFPAVSVRHRDSCIDVRRAVEGLRQVSSLHHAEVFGIVDNDGMSSEYRAKLESDHVYPLPFFSVESIYYSREILSAVANRQESILGISAAEMLCETISKSIAKLRQKGKVQHLASRLCERQLRDLILSNIPDRRKIIENGNSTFNISFTSDYDNILDRLEALVNRSDLDEIIKFFPVRESGILGDIAQALHFRGELDYEKAVLTTVSSDTALRERIRMLMGSLSSKLQ